MTGPQRDLSALRGGLSGLRQPAQPNPTPPAVPTRPPADHEPADHEPADHEPADHEPAGRESANREPTDRGAAAAPRAAATEPSSRSSRSGRKPAKPPAPAAAPGKRPIPVYLAAGTKTRLEQLARAEDATLAEWVLDRLDEFYDELGEVFRPAPARRSPLPPRQRIVRPRGEASTTVQLRLTDDEVAAIEKLRAQLEVPSRSALLARVIELGVERGNPG
jgi:hypothetical protein